MHSVRENPQVKKAMPMACVFKFMIVVNIVFTAYGAVNFATAIYIITERPDIQEMSPVFVLPPGTEKLITGITTLQIGVLGLLGVALRNRIFLLAHTILLTVHILAFMTLLLIACPLIAASKIDSSIADLKKSIETKYGKDVNFTRQTDEEQNNNLCCYYFGSGAENVYLKSPWHANARKANGKVVFPESCCANAHGACATATNLKEARRSGILHLKDCADLATDKINEDLRFNKLVLIAALAIKIPILVITFFGLLVNKYLLFVQDQPDQEVESKDPVESTEAKSPSTTQVSNEQGGNPADSEQKTGEN